MWLDWADQLKDEHPKAAKFLYESAKERLEKDFPTTHDLFNEMCSEDKHDPHCLNSMIEDHMLGWYDGMVNRIKRW